MHSAFWISFNTFLHPIHQPVTAWNQSNMFFTSILQSALLFASLQVVSSLSLNVTVVSSQNNLARFECWQLCSPLEQSTQFGIIGTATTFLGDVTNITYNVIPSGFDSGIHTAPSNQWVIQQFELGLRKLTKLDGSSFLMAWWQSLSQTTAQLLSPRPVVSKAFYFLRTRPLSPKGDMAATILE